MWRPASVRRTKGAQSKLSKHLLSSRAIGALLQGTGPASSGASITGGNTVALRQCQRILPSWMLTARRDHAAMLPWGSFESGTVLIQEWGHGAPLLGCSVHPGNAACTWEPLCPRETPVTPGSQDHQGSRFASPLRDADALSFRVVWGMACATCAPTTHRDAQQPAALKIPAGHEASANEMQDCNTNLRDAAVAIVAHQLLHFKQAESHANSGLVCRYTRPPVQATVNDQKLTEPKESVARTRLLLGQGCRLRVTLSSTCGKR